MTIARAPRASIAAAIAWLTSSLVAAVLPAAETAPVQFPDQRLVALPAMGPAGVAYASVPAQGAPTTGAAVTPGVYDPYAYQWQPSPLARFFGVVPAQAVAPIGPPMTVMSPPAGAAPYYSFQPSTTAPIIATPGTVVTPVAPVTPVQPYYPVPQVQAAGNYFQPGPYAEIGAVFLDRRNEARDFAILIDDDPPLNTDNNFFRVSQGDFNYEVGPRAVVGYDFNQRVAYEATYYGVYTWDWSRAITAPDDVNVVGDLGLNPALAFFDADTALVSLDSSFHNFELNRIGSFNDCVAWILGFRYVRLTEDFRLTVTEDALLPGAVTSRYNVDTTNNLFGAQLGLRLRHMIGNFSYDLIGKAGVYGNGAEQTQFVGTDGGATIRSSSTSGTDVAFVGDIMMTGRYHLSSSVALQGGYQAMWLQGVALATDQLDFTDAPGSGEVLDHDGGVFIHGAHAGLLIVW